MKRYRPLYPLLAGIGKPKNFNRFIIQANACISHDAYSELSKIQSPTFVIGVDNDKAVGINTSEETAAKIENTNCSYIQSLGIACTKKQRILISMF